MADLFITCRPPLLKDPLLKDPLLKDLSLVEGAIDVLLLERAALSNLLEDDLRSLRTLSLSWMFLGMLWWPNMPTSRLSGNER